MNIHRVYWLVAVAIFVVDRLTKYGALVLLQSKSYSLTSFLSFELIMNRGISWGMFHSNNNCAFMCVSLLIAVVTMVIAWHAWHMMRSKDVFIFGHVCIIAGSLSNIIDRIYYCGVIDFILLSYNNSYWPVFNIADVAIVGGVIIMLLQSEA